MFTKNEQKKLFWQIFNANNEDELHKIICNNPIFLDENNWFPYGGTDKNDLGNFGTFENQQPNPIAALVEKLTNSIDTMLLKHCRLNGINPKSSEAPSTMQDAVERFYGVKNGDFSEVSEKNRREIAEDIQIVATGDKDRPNLLIYDNGEGQHPDDFPNTFLSLHANNKVSIHFVQGKYNMGSTGAVVFCGNYRYQLIGSKLFSNFNIQDRENEFGFTLVRRHPLTEGEEKQFTSSWYEYFLIDGKIPRFPIDKLDIGISDNDSFSTGSIVKLYSYQLPRGSRSDIRLDLWRDLNQYLYHPALPMLILDRRYGDDRAGQGKPILGNKTRIIIDDRDKKEFTKSYTISTSDIGRVDIEATVFKPNVNQKEFINSKSVIFTRNGQVHGSLNRSFVSQELGLPMLRDSLLLQIDCTNVRTSFEQDLFMANRYNLKQGDTLDKLTDAITQVIRSDDSLRSLNQKRKEKILRDDNDNEDMLRNLLQSIPLDKDLLDLLKKDGTLNIFKKSFKFEQAKNGEELVEMPSISKRFPSIFKLDLKESKNGKKVKCIPLNGKGVLDFQTDVESEYLFRPKDRGELQIQILGIQENETTGGKKTGKPKKVEDVFNVTIAGPMNNSIRILLDPQEEALSVGDEAELSARLSSPDGDLEVIFYVRVVDPAKPKKVAAKKQPASPALPTPKKVYQKASENEDLTWDQFGWSGNDVVKVIPGDNGNMVDAIAINMDSYAVKRYLSRRQINAPKAIIFTKDKYFASVYLHSLFLYGILDKLNREEELKVDIEEFVPLLMKPYSSFLLYANTDEEVLRNLDRD